MKQAIQFGLYALLTCVLALANIYIYAYSYFDQTTPWMDEPRRVDGFSWNMELNFAAYGLLALLTTMAIYFAGRKAWAIKPAWRYALIAALSTAGNFGLYVFLFLSKTEGYLHEARLEEVIGLMVKTTLPMYFGVAMLICFLWHLRNVKIKTP